MKAKLLIIILFIASLIVFVSCEVEFNPNGDWKETTIVYGVLDQDADTNFIRVQKCFLGDGNYIQFAREKDSIYYKQDEIEVSIYGFYDWETSGWDTTKAKQTIHFNYTEIYSKPEGEFYSETAPIYFTKTKLNADFTYYLVVRNHKTGNITTANTRLVSDYKVTGPSGSIFGFNYNATYNANILTCKWVSATSPIKGEMARSFQPAIRFNFMENGNRSHINISSNSIINPFTDTDKTLEYKIFEADVLFQIKNKISERGNASRSFMNDSPSFEIYVYGSGESLKEYIDNNAPLVSLTEKPLYSNIENGTGIFSSRRLHIKKGYTEWSEAFEMTIKSYGIGF
ncbi:MAG: hypothetical protein PHO12_02265 [Bacteroidales bacterium]|nr:hypothetical protein [Bacteroidales bacterium]MDD4684921.1 hypothetical protein [Bacteroidales bacterium]